MEPEMVSIPRLIVILLLASLSANAAGQEQSWLSRSGYYRISFESDLKPLVINQIHSWTFHVETQDGEPVVGATISATGGMPLHNHGLPTDPKMTEDLGDGDYRFEGFRFHMNGDWELSVTVDLNGRRDTVVIPLTI